jgi:enamidase
MGSMEIRGLSGLVTGRMGEPLREVRDLRIEDGVVAALESLGGADTVIDAQGATAVPGLIDSHAHVVFGDWTPRQSALGWIASSMHGGVSMMMSASEVHLPGRPRDREGVKALAVAAQRAFANFRPGGVKVLAGAVIIEPTLEPADFVELASKGVWLAKVGFGDFSPQADAAPLVRAAQENGFVVMNHTGGASIPDSSPVMIDDVLALGCDIIGHANGGTTALPDEVLPELFTAPGAIQLVQAGNLRSSLRIIELARERGALDRIVIATDTPTGTGVMPLGMIKTVCELSSLSGLQATDTLAMATGNNGRVLRREEGVIDVGAPADLSLMFAPLGSAWDDPLTAIEHGDIPGIAAVVVDGELRALRSRNTPSPNGRCVLLEGGNPPESDDPPWPKTPRHTGVQRG